jgi:hypothetical protein
MPAYAGEQAAKLYEEGKFAEAEKAYAGLVESKQHGETVGRLTNTPNNCSDWLARRPPPRNGRRQRAILSAP